MNRYQILDQGVLPCLVMPWSMQKGAHVDSWDSHQHLLRLFSKRIDARVWRRIPFNDKFKSQGSGFSGMKVWIWETLGTTIMIAKRKWTKHGDAGGMERAQLQTKINWMTIAHPCNFYFTCFYQEEKLGTKEMAWELRIFAVLFEDLDLVLWHQHGSWQSSETRSKGSDATMVLNMDMVHIYRCK